MDRTQTIAMLTAVLGLAPTEDQITKAMAQAPPTGTDDHLNKALGDLRVAFERENAADNERLTKAMEESTNVVEAVTAGADAILAEFQAQNAALSKAAVASLKEAQAQRAQIAALVVENASIRTGVERLLKALDTPQAPRAVTGAQPIPTPADAGARPQVSAEDLISKSLATMEQLAASGSDPHRLSQLNEAVSQLNSGVPADVVAARYGLTRGAS